MCVLNELCDRASSKASYSGHRPAIGRADACGCPLGMAVADLSFPKGGHLFLQGDPARGLYSLTGGLVALERVNEDGEIVILKLLKPGALFPCADLFSDGHTTGARALTDTTVCFIPEERLLVAVQDPLVGNAIMRCGCEEARQNEEIIFRLCAADLGQRILAVLQDLAAGTKPDADGSLTWVLPVSWRDISAMVGTSPEVLSRTLRKLSDAGRLNFSGRQVTLLPAPVPPPIRCEAG